MSRFLYNPLYIAVLLAFVSCNENDRTLLWYEEPAATWEEALPLGNGHIAAMVYGDPVHERFQLNEETICLGSPHNNNNPKGKEGLDSIRSLIFGNRSYEAQELAKRYLQAPIGQRSTGAYQTAGELCVDFANHKSYSNYKRVLDLDSAVSVVTYQANGLNYKEEAFTSFTDQILYIRYTSSGSSSINLRTSFNYPEGRDVSYHIKENVVSIDGTTAKADAIPGGINFVVKAKVEQRGGALSHNKTELLVSNADTVIIMVSIATNYKDYSNLTVNPYQKVDSLLSLPLNFDQARSRHINYYRKQFSRVSLTLPSKNISNYPTDKRLENYFYNEDPSFVALYFQYGRYLLICSSQPGCQPANLQGKWNQEILPPWNSTYTININTEMNYWLANPTNLIECNEPLFKMIDDLCKRGQETAREMYGCRGWVVHHTTDIWRVTGATSEPRYSLWLTGNAWLCHHLWQHYLYTGDIQFLKRVWPCIKGAALFFLDFMVEDPRNGYFVVCPSSSPENSPSKYKNTHLFAGNTIDNELIYNLLTIVMRYSEVLGEERPFAQKCENLRSKLMPLKIGRYGQLQEWAEDWDSPSDGHRHVSHLWALYPGGNISPTRTPKEFEASRESLLRRGEISTGWSYVWKICLYARLLEGNNVQKLLKLLLSTPDLNVGGTYPNLFCAHPPFQIDGNLGGTAGISELLIQSYDGYVHLLPALPDSWSEGEVCGLCTQGGFVIEKMRWSEGKLVEAKVLSKLGGNLRIRSSSPLGSKTHKLRKARGENPNSLFVSFDIDKSLEGDLYDISTDSGDVVHLYVE